jgi:hypothetical protein
MKQQARHKDGAIRLVEALALNSSSPLLIASKRTSKMGQAGTNDETQTGKTRHPLQSDALKASNWQQQG